MRIRLILYILGSDRILPINYQYEFSAWIYKMLHFGDTGFAAWLHNRGYTNGKRAFKLFSFSNLDVERYKVFDDRFKILSDEATLVLTFYIDEAVQHFISGLFSHQSFYIGDRKSRVKFEVQTVETLRQPGFEETMRFNALSPICVTRPVEKDGKLFAEYLAPGHPEYKQRFFENLVTRYKTVHTEVNGKSSVAKAMEDRFDDIDDYRLKVDGKPKSRLVKIKADTPQETRIRGYLYDFECTAPEELLRFGYEAGFAEKNSLGFGCVGVENSKD